MAVKASATITISCYRDTQSVTRYYKLQASTASAPAKPTTATPTGWTDAEPTYTSGSTNTLYFVDKTVFSNGEFEYSAVSKSSSYEAAKDAYNKAVNAQNTANNAQDDIDNLEIGGRNYLLNSGFDNDYSKWETITGNTLTYLGTGGYKGGGLQMEITATGSICPRQELSMSLKSGETITCSVKVKSVSGTWDGMVARFANKLTIPYVYKKAINDDWTFYVYQLTLTSDTVIESSHVFGFYQVAGTFVIDEVKLEIGNRVTDWSPAPEDTQQQIDKLNSAVEVVVGTHTTNTQSWTGVANIDSLVDGQQITYWLPIRASSGSATLNLTLKDGTTTGAKNIYYGGTTRLTTHYPAGSVIRMIYRSNVTIGETTGLSGWWCDANYDSGNTYDRTRLNNSITAKTAISSARLIVGDDSGFYHLAASTAFDITKPILYTQSSIAASSTGTDNYLSFPTATLRNNLSGITLTNKKTCYIVGTLSGTTFTPNSTLFTTTVPTTEDGLTYIALGLMVSTYQIYLYPEHPIYQYKNGAFKASSQIAYEAQDTADSKRRVFTSQPTPPYDVGDLWVQGSGGDIMRCSTARSSGSYTSSDWTKASKYTDDTTVNNLQISGRNLLIGSGKYTETSPHENTPTKDDSYFYISQEDMYANVIAGQKYWIQCNTNGYWSSHGVTGDKLCTVWLCNSGQTWHTVFTGNGTETGRKAWSWTAPNTELVKIRTNTYGSGNSTVSFWDFKLESGDKATAWSPPPEDVDNKIDDGFGKLENSVNNQIDSVIETNKQYVDGALGNYVTNDNFGSYKEEVNLELAKRDTNISGVYDSAKTLIGSVESKFDEKFEDIDDYISIEDGIEIKAPGENNPALYLDSTGIAFKQGDNVKGLWDGEDFYTGNIVIEVSKIAQFGNFAFIPRSDGSLMFVKVGGAN